MFDPQRRSEVSGKKGDQCLLQPNPRGDRLSSRSHQILNCPRICRPAVWVYGPSLVSIRCPLALVSNIPGGDTRTTSAKVRTPEGEKEKSEMKGTKPQGSWKPLAEPSLSLLDWKRRWTRRKENQTREQIQNQTLIIHHHGTYASTVQYSSNRRNLKTATTLLCIVPCLCLSLDAVRVPTSATWSVLLRKMSRPHVSNFMAHIAQPAPYTRKTRHSTSVPRSGV